MIFLGSWASLNILSGTAGYFLSTQDARCFHHMNAGWNLINLTIAGYALYDIRRTNFSSLTYSEVLTKLKNLDQILLLNAGLDIGYMAAEAWLWERGIRKNSGRPEGCGKSLLLQGGFLLAFDLTLFLFHSPVTTDLIQLSDQLSWEHPDLQVLTYSFDLRL